MVTWFRYVPHGQILRFLARGWVIEDEFHGVGHGEFAVLMRWTGDGEPI